MSWRRFFRRANRIGSRSKSCKSDVQIEPPADAAANGIMCDKFLVRQTPKPANWCGSTDV
jgi:hypothetical protein